MEAEADRWNVGQEDEEHQKKRKRKGNEEAYVKSRSRETGLNDFLPPNVIDTGSLLKEGHPALNRYMREIFKMKDFGTSQWSEAGAFEHTLQQMERLQDKSVAVDEDDHVKTLQQSFIDNRRNYEAIKDEAKRQLDEEGVDWRAFDQLMKTTSD